MYRIRAGGGCVSVGETVWNSLKGGETVTMCGGKDFKKGGGKLGLGVSALQKGVCWNELWADFEGVQF